FISPSDCSRDGCGEIVSFESTSSLRVLPSPPCSLPLKARQDSRTDSKRAITGKESPLRNPIRFGYTGVAWNVQGKSDNQLFFPTKQESLFHEGTSTRAT